MQTDYRTHPPTDISPTGSYPTDTSLINISPTRHIPTDTSPTRYIPDGHFTNQTHSRRTFPRPVKCPTGISPTKHIPDGHFPDQTNARQKFPWIDASHKRHFPERLNTSNNLSRIILLKGKSFTNQMYF